MRGRPGDQAGGLEDLKIDRRRSVFVGGDVAPASTVQAIHERPATLHQRLKQYTRVDDAGVDRLITLYRKTRPDITTEHLYQIIASDFWMTSASFALPIFDLWERPRAASLRISGVQPGRLAQGPDEKNGRNGRVCGRFICRPFQNESAPVGERGPARMIRIFGALSTGAVASR